MLVFEDILNDWIWEEKMDFIINSNGLLVFGSFKIKWQRLQFQLIRKQSKVYTKGKGWILYFWVAKKRIYYCFIVVDSDEDDSWHGVRNSN